MQVRRKWTILSLNMPERVDNVNDVLSVGQEVDVKITEIDLDKKRISISIRALLDDAAAEETEDAE